jgi:hypothetical protein
MSIANHVVTPFQIENRLMELSSLIDTAHGDLRAAEEEYHAAKADFEVTYARAFLDADEKNAEATKSAAVLATQEQKKRLAAAEAIVRAARANVARLEQQVDITRSVGRLVTSSMNL